MIIALVISVLIKTFLVQAFYIPSGSMENTLLVNDRVLVNKLADKPDEIHRGDVVVFRDPGGWLPDGADRRRWRAASALIRDALVFVGLAPAAGERGPRSSGSSASAATVVCCDAQGRVTVNGVPLDEPLPLPRRRAVGRAVRPSPCPQGELWVMGDHRSDSEDSRVHQATAGQGFVPVDDVIGRAFAVVWPLDRARLPAPARPRSDQPQARLRPGP